MYGLLHTAQASSSEPLVKCPESVSADAAFLLRLRRETERGKTVKAIFHTQTSPQFSLMRGTRRVLCAAMNMHETPGDDGGEEVFRFLSHENWSPRGDHLASPSRLLRLADPISRFHRFLVITEQSESTAKLFLLTARASSTPRQLVLL